jgi:hypothetical protein
MLPIPHARLHFDSRKVADRPRERGIEGDQPSLPVARAEAVISCLKKRAEVGLACPQLPLGFPPAEDARGQEAGKRNKQCHDPRHDPGKKRVLAEHGLRLVDDPAPPGKRGRRNVKTLKLHVVEKRDRSAFRVNGNGGRALSRENTHGDVPRAPSVRRPGEHHPPDYAEAEAGFVERVCRDRTATCEVSRALRE